MRLFIRVMTVFLITIIMFLAIPNNVSAEEYSVSDEEISSQVNDMLADYDIFYSYEDMNGLSFTDLFSSVKEALALRIQAPIKLLGIMMIIIIFTSMMQNAGESIFPKNSSANIYNLVCTLAAVAVISPSLLAAYENTAAAIDRGGGFMLVFVPVLVGITIMSGGITSAGVYNAIALGGAELMIQLSRSIIMPVLTMTVALSVSGSVFPNTTVDSIVKLIKKIVTWGITVTVTLFTGFVSLKCTLGGKADGFAAKTLKFMISGFVPVIGSAVSDAYTTVKGSFDIMRCTAGTAGTIAVILIMLPPVIELIAFRVVMWIGGTVAEMFSVSALDKLLKGLDSGLAIAMSVLVSFGVMFVICTAILMKTAV